VSILGVVVIGRNEGERLRRCLVTLLASPAINALVYVDSGSADGSPALAAKLGAAVHVLDPARPFSAARARNEGFDILMALPTPPDVVQFIDGDCEVINGWLLRGMQALVEQPRVAVVCGRIRERSPDASPYNRLCDMEFDRPPGEVTSCGGIFMVQSAAYRAVGGFDPKVIAGEEAEMCLRLRRLGWKIHRLDDDMVWHDAQITRFSQWWKRMVRAGHAYAQGKALHGRSPQRHHVREVRSIMAWGVVLPIALAVSIVAASLGWTGGMVAIAVIVLGCVAMFLRIRRGRRRQGSQSSHASLFAFFCLLGKLPQAQGVLRFWRRRLLGRPSKLIEYKSPGSPVSAVVRQASDPGV